MKKLLSLAAAGLAIVLIAAPIAVHTVGAAEFIAPQGDAQNITLSKGETHKNVYIAGGSVFINSDTVGDLYAAGGTVIVEGAVEQDLVVAGGTVTLNGTVGGDVRVAGGNIIINGPVGGDVLVAGGTVHLTEKASVLGDLAVGSGDLIVDAPVTGTVKIGGGVVTLNSNMPGAVSVMSSETLTIGSKAVIPNSITHKGISEATVQEGAQIGTINFEMVQNQGKGHVGGMIATLFTITFVIKIIALVLAGLLLMKLFPHTSRESVEYMQRGMWANLGIGFLALIVGPIAFFILLISFFGMYIAFLLLFTWLTMLLLAALVASVFVGAWIVKILTKKGEMKYDWQSLLIGVVALGILMLVPVVGGLIFFILMLMAFGGIIRQFYGRIKNEQSTDLPHNVVDSTSGTTPQIV